jgi:hypothetical protein
MMQLLHMSIVIEYNEQEKNFLHKPSTQKTHPLIKERKKERNSKPSLLKKNQTVLFRIVSDCHQPQKTHPPMLHPTSPAFLFSNQLGIPNQYVCGSRI